MWKLRAAEKADRNRLLPANPGRQDAGVPSASSHVVRNLAWNMVASPYRFRENPSRPHVPRGDVEAPRRGEGGSEPPLAGKFWPAGCRRSQRFIPRSTEFGVEYGVARSHAPAWECRCGRSSGRDPSPRSGPGFMTLERLDLAPGYLGDPIAAKPGQSAPKLSD